MIEQDGTIRDLQHLVLDGFTYRYLEFPDGRADVMPQDVSDDIAQARVRWLSVPAASDLHNPFNPQPWLQAATVLREMGYDRASQYVAIQRRVHALLPRHAIPATLDQSDAAACRCLWL